MTPLETAGVLRNLFQDRTQYGRVVRFAELYGISRPTLYRKEALFRQTVCGGPGRRPNTAKDEEIRRLKARVAELEAHDAALQADLQGERRRFGQAVERTRFWLIALGMPARVIARLLRACFEVPSNRTDILRLTAHYARRATQLMREFFWPAAVDVDLDEVFIENLPLLVASDAKALAVFKTSLEKERTVAGWRAFLGDLPHVRRVTSDRGLAIRGAVAREGIGEVQSDIFHPIMRLRDDLRVMETRCYALMAQEMDLAHRLERTRRWCRDCRAAAARLFKVATRTRQAIACFDELEAAVHVALDALRLTTPQGSFNSSAQARADLQFAKAWIHAHLPHGWAQAKRALDDEALLTFLDEFQHVRAAIPVHAPTPEDRHAVLFTLTRLWEEQAQQRYRGKPVLVPEAIRNRLQQRCANLSDVQQSLFEILDRLHRASSGIECINSRVGFYRYSKRRFSGDFANLIAIWHNLSPFEDGKRANQSPAQILKINLPSYNLFQLFNLE